MTALTNPARDKLIGCLELVSRPGTEGERAAAIAAAMRILRARKLGWRDVIIFPSEPWSEDPAERWREELAISIRALDLLTEWERRFVISLRGYRRPSFKQQQILHGIAVKVRAA